jgi:hypothetical protein
MKDLHKDLDNAVIDSYGFNSEDDLLKQLLDLNLELHRKEENVEQIQSPGIPKH